MPPLNHGSSAPHSCRRRCCSSRGSRWRREKTQKNQRKLTENPPFIIANFSFFNTENSSIPWRAFAPQRLLLLLSCCTCLHQAGCLPAAGTSSIIALAAPSLATQRKGKFRGEKSNFFFIGIFPFVILEVLCVCGGWSSQGPWQWKRNPLSTPRAAIVPPGQWGSH